MIPPRRKPLRQLFAPRDVTETLRQLQSQQSGQLDPPTVTTQDGRERYALPYQQERQFNDWYKNVAAESGIDPNPDSPFHKYDYRGAWLAGESPQVIAEDNLPHWPSEFKDADHPNRFVKGRDTSNEGRDLRDRASRIQALMQRMNRAAPSSPRDATETERQGQGIGDIEAMRQMAGMVGKEVVSNLPLIEQGVAAKDFGEAAMGGDKLGMGLAVLSTAPMGKLVGKVAKNVAPAATDALIRTWHASKSDIPFTKFLREYFGTGSGGDRLGPAVYTTTARQESEEYLKNVAANRAAEAVLESGRRVPIPYEIATQLKNQEVPLEDIVSGAEKRLLSLQDIASKKKGASWSGSKTEKDIRAQSDLLSTLQGILSGGIQEIKRPGTLYEVGLDVSPEQLLNFDKDLIDQTPFVQDAIKSAMGIGPNPRSLKDVVAYRNMLNKGIRTPDVAKRLEDAGIQGVIARPAVSFPGSNTMNYATFNPDRAQITRAMGILGMLTGAGAAGKASQKDNRKKPQGS